MREREEGIERNKIKLVTFFFLVFEYFCVGGERRGY